MNEAVVAHDISALGALPRARSSEYKHHGDQLGGEGGGRSRRGWKAAVKDDGGRGCGVCGVAELRLGRRRRWW